MYDLAKYGVELIGTFVFLFVILASGHPLIIGLALAAVIFIGGSISGGHFNPAVSVMMFVKNSISGPDAGFYIAAQIAGGLAAWWVYKNYA